MRYSEMALAVLRSLPDTAVVMYDGDLRCLLAFGEESLDPDGTACLDRRPVVDLLPPVAGRSWEQDCRAALSGVSASVELPRPDGLGWQRIEITPWNDPSGADGGMVIVRDVTALEGQRKRAEEELIRSRQQALESSRLKSEFLANMSHEIRTPLNGVVCMSELLLATNLSDEQRDYARIAVTSADTLTRVLNDILDFSKIEAGKLDIVEDDYSLEAVAADVCGILGVQAHEQGVELAVSIEPEVPQFVRGDPNRVGQVLLNLVSNAVKFTTEGEIVVQVGVERPETPTERLRIEVTDTGSGIEPDRLLDLFSPFSQADSRTTRRFGGTGLGLCIAKQLVELMGGEIGARSEPGFGSTFWFELPCLRVSSAEIDLPVRDLSGTRVLVVDDNATNLRIIERQLTAWSMTPMTARDGRAALELLLGAAGEGRPIEVALIDMLMPGIDGLELARAIKASPSLRATRLIMLSSTHVRTPEAQAAGVDAVLSKPVRQSVLFDALARSLSRSSARPRMPERPAPALPASVAMGGRVLVAEDNEINQLAARRLLQKFGFEVDIACDGGEAIELSGRNEYAAVFMDCQMPGIDGYTASEMIRLRESDRRHTPIIAMTANAMRGDREKCLAAGMDDYVSKPLRMESVREVLTKFFDARSPNAAPLVDMEVVEELLADGGRDEGLVELFITRSHDRLRELEAAVVDQDPAAVARISHSFRGACATFGAVRLADLSGQLADASDPGLLPRAGRALPELGTLLAATEEILARQTV